MSDTQPVVVLGVIGSDCHAVGNKILERHFAEAGFRVVNLGVMVSQDEFVDAASENQADAVLVSSLYGQGELDCRGLRERFRERSMPDILLYIGGNLVVGKSTFETVEQRYKQMGFDRVFPPSVDLNEVTELLRADLAARHVDAKRS